MKTLVLRLAYDGTDFVGMQRQPHGRTVEGVLTKALERIYGEIATVVPAGRTDAGVHARGMVVHARLDNADRIPVERIPYALNALLPEDVRINGFQLRSDTQFHARYDARLRTYSYYLARCNDPLRRRYEWQVPFPFREEVLEEAAAVFVGTHDFTTFSKCNADLRSYICTVERCIWHPCGEGRFRLEIVANRFVYGMVRCVVGAMLDCARGKRSVVEVTEALHAQDRRRGSPLAPRYGLVFEAVEYPPELGVVFSSVCAPW